jgi:hypothetical protein
MRTISPLLSCLVVVSCATMDDAVQRRSRPVKSAADYSEAECEPLAVAAMPSIDREAARTLCGPLAASLGADHLGLHETLVEAKAEAMKRTVETLLAFSIVEYVPYDPSRIVIRAELVETGAGRVSAQDLVAFEHAPCAPDAPLGTSGLRWSTTVSVDAGSERTLSEFADRHLTTHQDSTQDILEAEILLRDPARFLPFAARQVAEAVRVSLRHP